MKKKSCPCAIELLGYIPPLQSAVTFGDDVCRVKIDIPLSECRDQAKALVDLQGKKLRILVEVVE